MTNFKILLFKNIFLITALTMVYSVNAQSVHWHCSKYSSDSSVEGAERIREEDGFLNDEEGDYDYVEESFEAASADLLGSDGSDVPMHFSSDLFYLMSLDENVISVGIMDLFDAYSGGRPVFIGERRLSACVLRDSRLPINLAAFEEVGVQPHIVEQMVKRSSISQGYIRIVGRESEMASCIARYHPAVGYISEEVTDDAIAPCF